jgi:hypothetical protein
LVDTDDTKTKGNDIGRIQKACSVHRFELMEGE